MTGAQSANEGSPPPNDGSLPLIGGSSEGSYGPIGGSSSTIGGSPPAPFDWSGATHFAHVVVAQQVGADLVAVVQLRPQHRAQLRRVGHALPHQLAPLLGHPQHDGAAQRFGERGIRLPETAGQTAARRLELGVDALGAGLKGREQIKLAHRN